MRFILICLDIENIYNCIYFILTVLAIKSNHESLVYGFLLLDIIKRSEDLRNVISSITTNSQNLLVFAFLGIIIMYIYAIIGYETFQ